MERFGYNDKTKPLNCSGDSAEIDCDSVDEAKGDGVERCSCDVELSKTRVSGADVSGKRD